MPDPKQEVAAAKKRAMDELNSQADNMGKVVYDLLVNLIDKTFDVKAGKIDPKSDFVKQLNRLTSQVIREIQNEPKFTGPVGKFIKRMPEISQAITEYQKVTNGVQVPAFRPEKTIVIDEALDRLTDNGLNSHFVQPLRDLIYRNFTQGLTMNQAKENIKEYIRGGKDESGKLHRYIEQTAMQTVDAYTGMINKKIMETFKMDAMIMTGSLIETSEPQCVFVREELDSRITRKNWTKVRAVGEDRNGWIEGTTFENLPFNKLHWGCRHDFFPTNLKQ